MDFLIEAIQELRHQVSIAEFTDLAARDILYDMVDHIGDLAAKVKEIERSIERLENKGSENG